MNDDQLATLEAGAIEGVAFDDLRVERDDDGFRFETPTLCRGGLDADGLREAAREAAPFVTDWWYWTRAIGEEGSARHAFLRWLERADERGVRARYADLSEGVTRRWGELAVSVRLGPDGLRTYDLRHADDANRPRADLDVRRDPLDAREIARFDDRGRYRPLKTAPTLRTGWAFADLDGDDLVRAVDVLYPATVANWHRERRGDLDVAHWRETAERQTGIYDVVDQLPDDAVEWAAEACCADSECLKRREWDLDGETPLGVDRGDGEFPCREPCSLFVAAAREWTRAEREEPRTYEFELTPGERAQLEAIVDAVAEGRVGEIREADFGDGANRYRARYLRAKRFGEDATPEPNASETHRSAGNADEETDGLG
jgi:hypothetical protein